MEVGRQGDPLSVSMVVALSHRAPGREEWRDLSFEKVQFASDFLRAKAHLRNGSWSPRGPIIGLDGRRIVASRTRSRGVARAVFRKSTNYLSIRWSGGGTYTRKLTTRARKSVTYGARFSVDCRRHRGQGREKWCDLASRKLLFAIHFSLFEARLSRLLFGGRF